MVARTSAKLHDLADLFTGVSPARSQAPEVHRHESGDSDGEVDGGNCSVCASIKSCDDGAALGRFFVDVLRVEHAAVTYSTPLTTCMGMSTLRLVRHRRGSFSYGRSKLLEFSWLMYTVLHPKSSSSSFRALVLRHFEPTNDTKKTLELVCNNALLRLASRRHTTPHDGTDRCTGGAQ